MFCPSSFFYDAATVGTHNYRPQGAVVEAKVRGKWLPATVMEDKAQDGIILIRWPDGSAQKFEDRDSVRYSSR